jgi:hypothetical protein
MNPKKILRFTLVLFFLVFFQYASVARDCKVKHDNKDGTYLVTINGQTLFAVPRGMLENALAAKKELEIAKARITRLEEIVELFKKRRDQADVTINRKEEIIKELKSIIELYKNMTREYKRIKSPLVTAEVGVGLTGDTEPAVMLGIGFKKLRIYGFFQKENAGAMVGLALPIF